MPFSNRVVENVIKAKKRSLLSNETLNDLLSISAANVSISDFDPNEAITLW